MAQTRPTEVISRKPYEVASWIEGSLTLSESTVVQHGGTIEHDLTVSANTHLDLHGAVEGDLIVEPGGIATVRGTVLGTLYNDGGEVEVCPGAAVDAVRDTATTKTRIAPGALVGE